MILDRAVWEGKIFAADGWIAGAGGVYPSVESATGSHLGAIGAASASDVADAAVAAARAQRDWAGLPYDHHAEVLRRAGYLLLEHAEEIHEWLIRESGATRAFAEFQTSVAAEECREAAALAAAPLANGTGYGLALGILTRDVMRGLSLAERIPSGLVHINDQTVNDEAVAPFGGVAESGTGARHGGPDGNSTPSPRPNG